MSFPNFQNQDQHPFCPKKTTHTNAPIIGIRIRRPMPQPKQHVLSVSFPKLSHKRKGKHKPPNAHNEQLHTPTPNNSSDSSCSTQNQSPKTSCPSYPIAPGWPWAPQCVPGFSTRQGRQPAALSVVFCRIGSRRRCGGDGLCFRRGYLEDVGCLWEGFTESGRKEESV